MARLLGLCILTALFGSLVCLEIECEERRPSHIIVENTELNINLDEPVSENNADQVQDANITLCCSNTTCIYDMVEEGLKSSQDFVSLSNLMFINGARLPDFILIDVHVMWTEYDNGTGTTSDHTHSMSYIWGETPVKAVFGPIQDLFQSISLFNAMLTTLALIEQSILPDELLTLSSENLEDWTVERNQDITLNISDTCISISPKLKEPNKALNISIVEILKQIHPLTTTGPDNINSNSHVLPQREATCLVVAFLVTYVAAVPFFGFLLIFVNSALHKPDCSICKKLLKKKTQQHLFLSTASTTWLILVIQVILTILLTIPESIHVQQKEDVLFLHDLHHEFDNNISNYVLGVMIFHGAIITFFTVVLLFTILMKCLVCKANAQGPPNENDRAAQDPERDGDAQGSTNENDPPVQEPERDGDAQGPPNENGPPAQDPERGGDAQGPPNENGPPAQDPERGGDAQGLSNEDDQPAEDKNNDRCSLANISTAAMIFFVFTFLWELIPLIPHFVLFPYHTLSIIVQYIGILFLLHCFMYHFLKPCSCSEFSNTGCCCKRCCKHIEDCCDKMTRDEPKDNEKCGSCMINYGFTWSAVVQVLLSLASLLFLVSIGFLYFMVELMGVNTAAFTAVILAIVLTVVTATATEAMKCIFQKVFECLKCPNNDHD